MDRRALATTGGLPPRTLRRRMQRFRAHLYYLRRPLRNFLPVFLLLMSLVLLGGYAFHKLYDTDGRHSLTFWQGVHVTYFLIFAEPALDFPDHWVLRLFYVILPPLGMVVVLDGILQFSYHLLRRDETSKEWVSAMSTTMSKHVILCGLGKLGLRILQQLLALGEQVVVLEKNPQCPNLAYAQKHGVPVLIGHGREDGIFDELNVAAAKSIILATNDDLANLEMALDARNASPQISVVLRMFDQELANKIRDSMNIQLSFSTSQLAAPLFATSSSDRSIINSFYVGDQLVVVAQFPIGVGSQLAGKRVDELRRLHRVLLLAHSRGQQQAYYPADETVLEVGDEVTIQTNPATLKKLHELNGERPS